MALSSADSDIFWWYKACLSFWLWLKNIWKTWIQILEHWCHPSSYLGYWHIFQATIYKLLKSGRWNIFHATCWTDEFETINKPEPSSRFHMWCSSCRFNRLCKRLMWLEGFRIKAILKSIVKNRGSWMLMGIDPLQKPLFWAPRWWRWQKGRMDNLQKAPHWQVT